MKTNANEKPILSISMLVSGREEMKKSLESLHYFTEAFPCEIVLVDTGCNEEYRAIAEQYADKIIDFEWCNDFAAARNVGLKASRGEWFMCLDDDEWFDNPTGMVDFFKSGAYKNFTCASYVVRNYSDAQGIDYHDSHASRMIKLTPEAKFYGKIHEYLEPFNGTKMVFADFAHHYGYVFENEEASRRHSMRNIEPLRELIKEEPGKNRWVLQLAQEYAALKDHEKAVEVCKEGLKAYEKYLEDAGEKAVLEPTYLGGVFAYLITSLDCLDRYEEGLEWMKKGLSLSVLTMKVMEPTAAFFHGAGARIYAQMENYEESCKHFREYLKFRKKLGDNLAAVEHGSAAIVSEVFQGQMLYGGVLICMESLIRMEDEKLAEKAFYLIDWSDKRLLGQGKWEQRMVDACCHVVYRSTWVKILQTLVSREGGMKEMYAVFLTVETNYKQGGETEKIERLRRLVSELKYDHHYIVYTKILWESRTAREGIIDAKGKARIESLFAELFEKYPSKLPDLRQEVWEVAEKLGISLDDLFLKIDYRAWKDGLDEWKQEASLENLARWEKRIAGWKGKEDARRNIFGVKCAEGYLLHYQKEPVGISKWEEALKKYADSALALYAPLYKEDVLAEIPETLPDEVWIALYLKKWEACREKRDDAGALSALRKCLGVSVALEKALEAYAEVLKQEVQNRDLEAAQAKEEMKKIAEALKQAAKQQIGKKEYAAAREILLQTQACVPEDQEVKKLLRQIENE